MGYTIRRWITCTDNLFDESMKAGSATEAVACCKKLAGIFHSVVDEKFISRINSLQVGETARVKNRDVKLTIVVRRTKK